MIFLNAANGMMECFNLMNVAYLIKQILFVQLT